VAHGYVVRAVHAPCALVYQHSERICCELHACLLNLQPLIFWKRAVCECPVSLYAVESKLKLIYFCAATFLGVRRAITRSARTWALSRRTKARTPSRWPYQLQRRTLTRCTRTRYTCCRPSHPKRRKRWIRQPNRRTSIVISGRSMLRLFIVLDGTEFLSLCSVLLAWVLSNVST
jgi:hypothetical protein